MRPQRVRPHPQRWPGSPRRRGGFSLIELMTVVATLGILASIALPSMQDALLRVKRGEREQLVQLMAKSMRDYLEQNPNALTFSAEKNPSGPPNSGRKPFDRTVAGWSQLIGMPEGSVYHQFAIDTTPTPAAPIRQFTLTVTSDLDGNTLPSVLTVTYTFTGGDWVREDVESGDTY